LGAREYDPTTGRFISVDPLMDLADPQQWNAYTYSGNNPVTFSDPSGLKPKFDNLEDQRAWAATGGNKFARKKRLKGYFKQNKNSTIRDVVTLGLTWYQSSYDGMYDITIGGLIQTGQLIADQTQRGFDRWSKVLDGEWTVGQAIGDAFDDYMDNGPKPWDTAVGLVDLAIMSVNAQTALAKGDFQTAAENYGYLGGIAAGIVLTERASKFGRGCHSFAPMTPVLLANGSTKAIGEVAVGELVLATDPETGETTRQPVTELHLNEDWDLAEVDILDEATGQTTTLETTWHHPFWNATDNRWTDAADLTPGTRLRNAEGNQTQQVVAVRTWTGLRHMRDLTIADIHTYYVLAGNTPILVHNDDGPGMLGASGTQVTSKMLWERGPYRIDVENPNPGQRPGQVHFQDVSNPNVKYIYNFETRQV
jgi:Pretoxin HINT domain